MGQRTAEEQTGGLVRDFRPEMKLVHKLFSRQSVQALSETGEIDLGRLGELVSATYERSERDRRRSDRSMMLMVEELDRLNRELEHLVEERTRELREREAQLQTQNMRFDATINHMPQALLMFDASGRLMVCNHRYNDMYGLPAQFVQPGKTIRELLDRRKQNGTYPGDPGDYIEKLTRDIAQGQSVSQLVELPDGRTISVLNHPMPGGGWVATHEDITERRRAEHADRPHGAPRRSDQPAQPRAAARTAGAGAHRRAARRATGCALSRSRPLQERQRHARPIAPATSCSRLLPTGCRAACANRIRWRAPAATSSPSFRPAWSSPRTPRCSRAASARRSARPVNLMGHAVIDRHQHRHRDRAGRRHATRRAPEERRHGALRGQGATDAAPIASSSLPWMPA